MENMLEEFEQKMENEKGEELPEEEEDLLEKYN